jgi:hypothetical protein
MKFEVIRKNYIYKFDDIIDYDICDEIYDFYINTQSNDVNNIRKLPWFENNIIYFNTLNTTRISSQINLLRNTILECAENSFGEKLYSNASALVMWKEGKSMATHKDNGYEHDKHILHMRKYTGVFYINDDYEGGETYILKENSDEFEIVNKPRKTSLLLFKSDDSCLHGVQKVKKGNRLTFAIWFSDDEKYKEYE